jgi:catechol 2,3-dioxygenase-like lactoylglutathione lyase family enzyme
MESYAKIKVSIAQEERTDRMKISLSSIYVENQEKALKFYTETLGFIKKNEIPVGAYKWLTVVSPQGNSDVELVLEPNQHPAAKTYQREIYKAGIPITAFEVDDINQEYERLTNLNVNFKQKPLDAGNVKIAIFDDTCGNLIQIYQPS